MKEDAESMLLRLAKRRMAACCKVEEEESVLVSCWKTRRTCGLKAVCQQEEALYRCNHSNVLKRSESASALCDNNNDKSGV